MFSWVIIPISPLPWLSHVLRRLGNHSCAIFSLYLTILVRKASISKKIWSLKKCAFKRGAWESWQRCWGLDPPPDSLNVFCFHHTLLNNIFVALSISEISKEKD